VKVLDFGLAKALEPASSLRVDVTISPTITSPARMTGVGTILGTAAYMSPEQAKGRAADKRSDVWAFGCVLYEMLTGEPAFGGDTLADVIAAVVKNEPDWGLLPHATTNATRSLMQRCLRKDPELRLHDVADARIEIVDILAEPKTVSTVVPRIRRRWTGVMLLTASALAAVVIVMIGVRPWLPRDVRTNRPVTRTEMNLPNGLELYAGAGRSVALSPDGTRLAFIGVRAGLRQVYLRNLERFGSSVIRGTDTAQTLFFSPDGGAIAFLASDRTLKKASLSDGLVV